MHTINDFIAFVKWFFIFMSRFLLYVLYTTMNLIIWFLAVLFKPRSHRGHTSAHKSSKINYILIQY